MDNVGLYKPTTTRIDQHIKDARVEWIAYLVRGETGEGGIEETRDW